MMKSLPGQDYYEPRTMRITSQRKRGREGKGDRERGSGCECEWEDKRKPSQSLKPATVPPPTSLVSAPVRVDLSSLLATFFRPDAF